LELASDEEIIAGRASKTVAIISSSIQARRQAPAALPVSVIRLENVAMRRRTNNRFWPSSLPQPHTNALPAFSWDNFHASKGAVGLDVKPTIISAASQSILNVLCQGIACRARDIFCDRAGQVALPWEIPFRHTRVFDFWDNIFSFGSFHEIHLNERKNHLSNH